MRHKSKKPNAELRRLDPSPTYFAESEKNQTYLICCKKVGGQVRPQVPCWNRMQSRNTNHAPRNPTENHVPQNRSDTSRYPLKDRPTEPPRCVPIPTERPHHRTNPIHTERPPLLLSQVPTSRMRGCEG